VDATIFCPIFFTLQNSKFKSTCADGRDPFVGGRIMWRVMCWTDDRMYKKLPDVCLCGCGQEYGGTDRGTP
jgi:hypothetical protein